MSYTLKEDELAIIIRPRGYTDPDGWAGEVSISLSNHEDTPVPTDVQAHVFNMATMMSAFLDLAREEPDLYDAVEDHRNYLMGIDVDDLEENEEVVHKEGNVYTLNRWTKTEGSA